MRGMPTSVETVSLAAEAIASAENRAQQNDAPQRKKWISCFSLSCFSSNRPNHSRINHAPSPSSQPTSIPPVPVYPSANSNPLTQLPFTVPPSSPATSSLQSEPASLTLSPAGPTTLTFSPVGPTSIFAIGPYAYEKQLVSPPVFSTEPSTAPFTPPPESVHLTTPSSPEVPFAQFLSSFDPTYRKTVSNNSEFSSYQFPPGSPIGQLISPTSGCSSRSSPYREGFVVPFGEPPKIMGPEGIAAWHARKSTPWHARKDGSLLDGCISAVVPEKGREHSVSFDLGKEAVELNGDVKDMKEGETVEIKDEIFEECQPSISNKGSKEFVFENTEAKVSGEPVVGSDWWTEEKVATTSENQKNWPFFPIVEPSVSR
ncbi:hypothetical protein LUZ61_018517 [Rhynchospora tenuis]|uniref:Uncharacterized protein n=1 Tax=Rhynchospora tenuis TaxID=198213 RepID=A0AAD5Z9I5_9POAL|nr:hypothetical protein LUZ61_018517 [Rhynchospora tenuis]